MTSEIDEDEARALTALRAMEEVHRRRMILKIEKGALKHPKPVEPDVDVDVKTLRSCREK